MEKLKRLFDLQLFSEDGSNPNNSETPEDKGANSNGGDGGAEKKPQEPKQPFAIFPDQKSFMARVEREARKIYNNNLKELGITSADELKNLVENYRELEASTNAEIMTREERIKALEEENGSLVARITTDLKNKAVREQALELGVQAERFERFMRLVDMNAIEINEGVVNIEPLKEQITGLLDEFPEFRGVTESNQGGSSFNGDGAEKPKFTIDQIKSMSTEEILANYNDVMAVVGSQK